MSEQLANVVATAGRDTIRVRFFAPRRRWYGLIRQDVVVERWQDAGIGAYIVPIASHTIRPVDGLSGAVFREELA